jgi:hypothetical protein
MWASKISNLGMEWDSWKLKVRSHDTRYAKRT